MVFPISLQAPYHASDRHQFHLAGAWETRQDPLSTAEPSDFTPDRMGHASERPGVLLAR